jgi:hypothetical protein
VRVFAQTPPPEEKVAKAIDATTNQEETRRQTPGNEIRSFSIFDDLLEIRSPLMLAPPQASSNERPPMVFRYFAEVRGGMADKAVRKTVIG